MIIHGFITQKLTEQLFTHSYIKITLQFYNTTDTKYKRWKFKTRKKMS